MEINERNAKALNDEQIRQRDLLDGYQSRIQNLESEIVQLRSEMHGMKLMIVSRMGGGSSA
jgi:peptidoglycan hydrolase CwlO-like protein